MDKRVDYTKMKPIWYFVGLILLSMGVVINLTGIYDLFSKSGSEKIFGGFHTNIWWGELMAVVGVAFILFNRKPKAVQVKKARKK